MELISFEKKDLFVLNLHGGGVKGCSQIAYLELLDNYLKTYNTNVFKLFDLIIGTSVGSIIGGCLSSGNSPSYIKNIFNTMIPKVFDKRFKIPRYNRNVLITEFKKYFGEFSLQDLKTEFIATSVNACDNKTHYFKSWEEKDSKLQLLNVILRSSAAPYFFGRYEDDDGIWLDGGVGANNNPIMIALVECFRQRLFETYNVNIVSVGTGYSSDSNNIKLVKNWNWFNELLYYFDFGDGGRARDQILTESESNIKAMNLQRLNLYSINKIIPKKYDVVDGVKYMDFYNELGLDFFDIDENKKLLQTIDNIYKLKELK